jgi:plasmid stability protein
VLTGIHNELRRQTQARLAHDLVGGNKANWLLLTTQDSDFKPPANAQGYFGSGQIVLAVVKKNATVLRKLIAWLGDAGPALVNVPALIIDDEADQASVATKTINPLLLDLFELLPKAGYVAYTATPFANLLIDPASENLYPEDFVVALGKAKAHFGAEDLFGRDALDYEDQELLDDGFDMIREVPLTEVRLLQPATTSDVPSFVPSVVPSLADALDWFLLATAARRVRGRSPEHATMLIHTTMRTAIHHAFVEPVERFLAQRAREIRGGREAITDHLRSQWEREVAAVPPSLFAEDPIDFDSIVGILGDVIDDVRVVVDNSRSTDRLDYSGGAITAIAIGGNTLSRGLTLRGLSVSYFVRSAGFYDTLMQMGRWFGFRKGYADLPRIWMTKELARAFRHLAMVEAEMRDFISQNLAGELTPSEVAIRIRTHHSLRVTNPSKMRSAQKVGSAFGGQRAQPRFFRAGDKEWLDANMAAVRRLAADLVAIDGTPDRVDSSLVWRGIPADVILDFLDAYQFHDDNPELKVGAIRQYIDKRIQDSDELTRWNVVLMGSGSARLGEVDLGSGITLKKSRRSKLKDTPPAAADIKTLMSRRDAALDLLPPPSGSPPEKVIVDRRSAEMPGVGLLVLYVIDAESKPKVPRVRKTGTKPSLREPLAAVRDVAGAALVFPRPEHDEAVYVQADIQEDADPSEYEGELEEVEGLA